jgi:SAM-dependent methyltransferase
MDAAVLAPCSPVQLADIPFAQASLEELRPLGIVVRVGSRGYRWPAGRFPFPTRGVRISGWMLMPDGPFDRIHAHVNGDEFFTCDPWQRDDLSKAFNHISHAGRAGFTFEIPRRIARKGRIEIIGKRDGRPVGRMQFRFRYDLHRRVPTPPPDLTQHVSDTSDPNFFLAEGYKAFDEMNNALLRHSPEGGIRHLLDWGCGCGRLAAHWLRQRRIPHIYGCDINAKAIAWCSSHLRRGQFTTVPFDPPTAYPDANFDAIAAYSVFTHLTASAQWAWLAEMHRILKPHGIFVASVHGTSAAWFRFGPEIEEMLASGIHDGTPSPGIENIVGSGVYRNTYQTPEYTRNTFGRWFEVLEYIERGVGNNQDLVVLRKPK